MTSDGAVKKIEVPFDLIVSVQDIQKIPLMERGLYFLYDSAGELLYIGWASYLRERIRSHVSGKSINTRHFADQIHEIRILFADSFPAFRAHYPDCGDIEFYLIHHMKPKYNVVRSINKAYKQFYTPRITQDEIDQKTKEFLLW